MEGRLLARLETGLIALMLAGFVLITQQWSFVLYQAGLVTVVIATILNIAVSNVPHAANGWRAVGFIAVILAVVAGIFWIGILLVPALANLGQSS